MIELVESALRMATPLIFAALGGMLSERSGVIQIALEGILLSGAFAGAAVTAATHSPWLGAGAAMGAGMLTAGLYAFSVITLRADQIVAGTAINMMAAGVTPFLCKILYGSSTATPSIAIGDRFASAPVWVAFALVPLAWLWLEYTPSGAWVRFAGEKPEALDAAGVRVNRVRWAAVLACGAVAGFGGVSLSVFLASSFTRNMSAGRGFMALAALIFGKWRPWTAAAACVLFGCTDALQIRLQGVPLWGGATVPVQLIQALPYLVTVAVLAGFVGRSRAPAALGVPFVKG